jgi:hypothetical protein
VWRTARARSAIRRGGTWPNSASRCGLDGANSGWPHSSSAETAGPPVRAVRDHSSGGPRAGSTGSNHGRGSCAINASDRDEWVHLDTKILGRIRRAVIGFAGTRSTATAGLAGIESPVAINYHSQLASAEGLPDASPRTIAASLPEHGGSMPIMGSRSG